MKRVCFVYPPSYHYRAPFHEEVRKILADFNIIYELIYSKPDSIQEKKRDTVVIEWAKCVPIFELPFTVVQIKLLKHLHPSFWN